MAASAHVYPQAQQKLGSKAINLTSDSLKVMLLSSYTYSDSHATMADVKGAGAEASGTGYTAGGQALSGVSLTTSGKVTKLTCSNPSWPSSTVSAAFAVFYDAQGGTDATNIPICYTDFGGTVSSSSGTLSLTVDPSGLATLTAS